MPTLLSGSPVSLGSRLGSSDPRRRLAPADAEGYHEDQGQGGVVLYAGIGSISLSVSSQG